MQAATETISLRPRGSMVEALGRKLLRDPDNSRAGHPFGPGSQMAETAQQRATLRNRSWFVRHDS
jgi:hypothetical protein